MNDSLFVLLILVALSTVLALIPALTYRSVQVLLGKKPSNAFPRNNHEGPAWYKRVMDSHANSLENLILYTSIVIIANFSQHVEVLNAVCWYYLAARFAQTIVHLISTAEIPVSMRFAFWLAQMGLIIYVFMDLLSIYLLWR